MFLNFSYFSTNLNFAYLCLPLFSWRIYAQILCLLLEFVSHLGPSLIFQLCFKSCNFASWNSEWPWNASLSWNATIRWLWGDVWTVSAGQKFWWPLILLDPFYLSWGNIPKSILMCLLPFNEAPNFFCRLFLLLCKSER